MSNMGYCRFRNTVTDLADCAENLNEELSEDEARARKRLIKLAYEIVEDFLTNDGLLDMDAINDLPTEKEEDDEEDDGE